MKTAKKSVASRIRDAVRRDAFRIEPLEPRVLLSADPVFMPLLTVLAPDKNEVQSITQAYSAVQAVSSPVISAPLMAKLLSNPAAQSAAKDFPVDAVLFDMSQVSSLSGFMDSSLRVASNEILGGSGTLDLNLINTGVVSPGYSPGVQNVTSYTQAASATLKVEIGGDTAGTGTGHYDQLNVSGAAKLDGSLAVSLYGGYKPKDGQVFTVMNFGSASGQFANATGLIQANDQVYFEVKQDASKLTLTAHTVAPSMKYVFDAITNEPVDQIGEWLNFGYFKDSSTVNFSGSLDLGNGLKAQGNFTLGYAANQSFTPVGGTALNTDIWSLSAKNVSGFVGVSGKGLGLSGLDIDMAFVQADQAGASYGWVLGKGQADSAAISGISGLSLKGTSLALDLNYGYGKLASGAANDALLNLSTHAIKVGSTTFNANGAGGEYLVASGTLAGSVGDVSLKATVGVSVIGTDFVMAGKNVTAKLSAGGVSVGVSNGAFGLVSGGTGMAFEASGSLSLSGGGFASVSAQSVRVVLNRTGVSQTGHVLDFAGSFSYTFGEVAASSNLQSVSVVGLAASLGSGLSVAGNFFFEKDAATNSMRAVAVNASAKVSAGTFNVGVSQASLGLVISSAGRVLQASGAISANLGSDVALSAKQVTLRLNETAANASSLKISAAGHAYTFGTDLGAGVHEVSVGGAVLTVAGFVQASGALAVRWAGQPVALNLADGSTRQVNQLWIGGSGLSAAVGLNPGKSGFVGFKASGLEFVLGLFSDKTNSANKWTSLSGKLGAASLSGISGVTVAASGLALTYNTASAGQRVADFVGSHSQGITVAGKTLNLSADGSKGSLLQASGQLNLDVYGFVQLSGQLAIEKKTQGVTLGDGSKVSTQMLTIGGENLSAFVGMNGARADRTGLSLTGAAFGLVLASDLANPARKWTSLQASATAAKLQGVNGLTMGATSLQVMLNRAATDGSLIDYQAAPLAVKNGVAGHTLSLSMDASAGELTQASGHLKVDAYGFLQVDGDFSLSKSTDKIKLTGASVLTTVDLLTIGVADANAFAGMNAGKANAIGLSLGHVDFALALMQEKVATGTARSWSAARASAGSAAFVGVDGLTIAASGVEVDINRQAADLSVVDFASKKLTVSTGPASELVLDLNGNQGQLLQASGHLKLDVFGFVQLEGDFAIQKSTLNAGVTLSDGKNSGALELLTIGASNVRAFAGLNGGKTNAIGLELSGVDFGLALMSSKTTPARSWTSLQASADSAAFIGVDGLTVSADTLSLNINQAGKLGDAVVDYSAGKTALSVATGAASKIALSMDGADGEMLSASGNLTLDVFGFFQASGGFAIEKRSASVVLSDGTATKPASTIAVDLLTIGGSGIDAFAGINGGKTDALGLSLSEVSFGLALMTEKGTAKRQFTSLQATAGAVELIGVDGVTLSATSLQVQVNRGIAAVGTKPAVEVDYAVRQMDIATGPDSHLTLDMDGSLGELTRARGQLDINLFNFVSLQGNFAFDKYDSTVKLSDKAGKPVAKEVAVDMLTIDGSDINAFAGISGGSANAIGLSLGSVDFALALMKEKVAAGSKIPGRSWSAAHASAGSAAFIGVDGLTIAADGVEVDINRQAEDFSVVDFSKKNLTVSTGPASELVLDLNGNQGQLLQASGHLKLDVFGFVQLEGDFAIEKSTLNKGVILADGKKSGALELLTIGASNVRAFAGLNGGKSNAIGLELSGVDFGLALMSSKTTPARSWTSLQATASSAAFVGVDGLTVSADTLSLNINQAGQLNDAVVDYSTGKTALSVVTGGAGGVSKIALNMDGADGELLRASGNLTLDVFGFFQASGGFAIEKRSANVTLSDGTATKPASTIAVDLLTIGGSGIDAFAGINGGTANAMGLSLSGVEFGLALMTEKGTAKRQFTSLQATAGAVSLVGVKDVTLSATSLQVQINRGVAGVGTTPAVEVDYAARQMDVTTGPGDSHLTLDMDGTLGELTRARGQLDINLYNFVSLQGNFAFNKYDSTVKLSDKSGKPVAKEVAVSMLTIGGSDINAFAGMNAGSASAIGLSLGKVDFALALMQEKVATGTARSWSAARALAGSAAFVGVDGLTLAASGVQVDINRQAADLSVVDFASKKLTVSTGPASELVLDLNGNQGQLLQASGHLKLDVFGFVQLEGDFAIQKSTLNAGVTLSDGKNSGALELLTIGASNVRAFAGLNGGKANAIGLELSGVSFGLAIMTSKATPARSWTSLQASATSAAFVGVDGLTVSADTLSLNINQAGQLGDAVVDYSTGKTALSVATGATGAASKIALNMDGADGELLRASGNLTLDVFGFFQASGGFAIEKRSTSVTLSDGTATKPASTIAVDLLTIGGSGIDAFAGINGGTANAMGLSLSNVEFGLALMTEKGTAKRQFTSLQASAGAVSLVGVKDVTLSATSLQVQINRGVAGVGTTPAVEVDYAARQMDVTTGPGDSHLTLDMDGTLGELTRARGQLDINLYNFVSLQGNFAFDKYDSSVKLSDKAGKPVAKEVAVSMLTIGGSDINAFVGMNGERDTDGKLSSDAFGLDLTGASFGLALITDKQTPTRKWTSLQASAAGLSFVGLDGLTAAGSNINIALNQAANDASVVDYAAGATDLSIATGPTSAIALDMSGADGPSLKASAHLTLDMFGFFQVNGDFALSKSAGAVKLSNGQTIERADQLTIGGHGVNVFAGIGGGTSSALGAQISNVNFALALITDPANAAHKFTSLQATAGSASLIGVDALTLSAADLSLSLNRGFSVPAVPEVTTRTNTRLQLSVPPELVGTVTISKAAAGSQAADSAKVTLSDGQSNGQVISALTAAFESLSGVGVGNVLVTGNRYDGYVIEFIGALAGRDVVGISVSAAAASVSTSVVQTGAPQTGVNEVKRLVIKTLSSGALPVTVDVSTATQGVPGQSETNTITFTQPGTAGSYSVFLSADGNVTVDTHAQTGQSQVQRLTLNAVGAPAASVVASVSEESAAQTSAASEIKVIKFLTPTKTKGPYTLSLGGQSVEVTYTQNDWGSNQRYIKQALATLLKTSPKNITVGFDDKASRKGPYCYNIYFDGALANQDIGDITVTGALGKEIILDNARQQGASGASEVQRVTLKASGAGQFTLSVVEGGKTYTTASLAFGASAAQVQTALNAALSAIGGSVSVSQASNGGDYLVTFAGSLANRSVAPMTIAATAQSSAPTGSFTLSLGGVTSAPIAYSADAGVMAQRIEASLAAMKGIGAGNVQVSVDSAHSAGSATSFAITLRGAATSVALASVNASALKGVQASAAAVNAGTAATSQVQGLSVGSHALSVGYSVSLSYAGQTYTSAAITASMSQAQVQSALSAAVKSLTGAQLTVTKWVANDEYSVSFGGTLAGQELELLAITPRSAPVATAAATGTGQFVVGNTAQNITNLRNAYAAMLGTSTANISVKYDASYSAGERYVVSFVGALKFTDIADKTLRYSGAFDYQLNQSGAAPVAEVQTVKVDRSGQSGTFALSLTHGGKTYTSAGIALGATAAQVQNALNAALAGLTGATVSVTSSASGEYEVTFGGSLLGVDVAQLQVASIAPTPDKASGSFTIELDGQMSGAIAYSASSAVMAANIQKALQAMSNIGAGNVLVSVDAANTQGAQASYTLSFTGALAATNVSDVTAHFENLTLGEVTPIRVTDGSAKVAAEQTVTFTTAAQDADFTLALTYGGKTYTTASLSLQATPEEVQAAVTKAFGAIAGAQVSVSAWTGKALSLSFGGSLAGQAVPNVVASATAKPVTAQASVLVHGKTVVTPATPARTVVIDYAPGATDLKVDTSGDPATAITLDMKGELGALTRVQIGRATLAISDYIYVSGGFYMEMADSMAVNVVTGLPATYAAGMDVALKTGLGKITGVEKDGRPAKDLGLSADHSRITGLQVKTLTLSFTDVALFAGLGPYFIDTNSNGLKDTGELLNAERTGITLDKIDLALVMMSSTLLSDPDSVIPKFFALQLDWKKPLDVDMDYFKFKIDDLQVQANQGGKWRGAPTLATPFIDFKSSFGATGYEISTSGESIFLKYDSAFVGVSIGHALLNVGDFFQVEGSFALQKVSGQKVDIVTGLPAKVVGTPAASLSAELTRLKTAKYLSANNALLTDVPVDMLSIGAADVKITVGSTSDPLFTLDNIDMAFTTMKATTAVDPTGKVIPRLFAVKALWANPLDLDMGFMQVKVSDLTVELNKGSKWKGTELSPYVDFTSSFGADGLSVATGGAPIALDFNRSMFGVSVKHALIKVDDFIYLEGGFAIEKSASTAVDISTGFSDTSSEGAVALKNLVTKKLVTPGKYSQINNLAMDVVTVGFSNVKLFAGSGPYFVDKNGDGYSDSTDSAAVGVVVDNLNLGMAIYTASDASLNIPKLWALNATVDQAAFVGLDFLTLSAEGVTISANQGGVWAGSTVKPYVNFVSTYGADGLLVPTGNAPVALAYTSGSYGVQIAKATLQIDQFVFVQGAFSLQKGEKKLVTIDTGLSLTDVGMASTMATLASPAVGAAVSKDWKTIANLQVDAMTLGMENVNVFVGYGTPDFESAKPIKDQPGLFGLALKNVDMALAILTPTAKNVQLPKFTALKASAGDFVVAGGDGIFNLSGNDIAVNLNWGSAWAGAATKHASVDFKASFGAAGLAVPTGAGAINLDFTESLIEAKVSNAMLMVSEFVFISGDFAFKKGGQSQISVKQGLKVTSGVKVQAIDIGAENVHAFVGLNGPTRDTNKDGKINTDDLGTDAMGLRINDLDFGMSILTAERDLLHPAIAEGTKFLGLKAHANGIGMVGFGDFIQFDLSDASVSLNQGSKAGMVADFTQGGTVKTGRTVQTGGANPVQLDFSSELIEASVGLGTLNVAGVVSLQGGFAFQKRQIDRIGFNMAGVEVVAPADALVVAGVNVQAFAGFNGPYKTVSKDANGNLVTSSAKTGAVGFAIDNMDFILSMLTPSKASGFAVNGVNFYSLYAKADKAGLVGTDPYLTLDGTKIEIKLNGAIVNGYPIPSLYADYTEMTGKALTIKVGTGTASKSMSLNYSSNLIGIKVTADLGIFDLFHIKHDFDFQFDLPKINLGNIGLPNLALPNLDFLKFKLPSLQAMKFEMPSFLTDLKFDLPNFKLPTLPNVNWATLLGVPDLNVNLPRLSLSAWVKLSINLPSLKLQFPAVSFPALPDFPDLSWFGLPNLFTFPGLKLPTLPNFDWAVYLNLPGLDVNLPKLSLPAIGKLIANWPQLKLQFPKVAFPALPDFNLISLGVPTFDIGSLRALYAHWPELKLQFPSITFPNLPAFPDLSFGLPFLKGLPLFEVSSLSLPDLKALVAAWPKLRLDFPQFDLPALPKLPDLSMFTLPSVNWSAPKIDLSAFTNLVLNLPDLKLQFPDLVFPDITAPDFGLKLPSFALPTSFLPTISLSGLKDLVPDVSLGFLKDAFNFISNIDLSIGVDLNFKPIVLGKISLPNVNLHLENFVHLHGNFELNLGQTFNGTMYTGLPAELGLIQKLLPSTADSIIGGLKAIGGLSADFSRLSNVDFRGLTLGGSDISAFVGAGTPDFSKPMLGQSDLVGFGLDHLDIGVGIFKAQLPAFFKATDFMSLTAHANSISTYGFGDVLKLTAENITLDLNSGGKLFGGAMRARADFATTFPAINDPKDPSKNKPLGYKVQTGDPAKPVYLKFGGEDIIGLDIGMATIQVSQFLSLRGSLAFRKGEIYTVDVNPGGLSGVLGALGMTSGKVQVEAMTLGGANLTGFAGVGGPYRYGVDLHGPDGKTGGPDGYLDSINTGAVGLVVDHVDFGLAMMTPKMFNAIPGLPDAPKFISAKAKVGDAFLTGINKDLLDVQAHDVEVNINTFVIPGGPVANAALQLFGPPSINYKTSFATTKGLAVPAGGTNSVLLDFAEEIIQAKVGYAQINLAGFVQLSASMAFTKKGSETVTLSNGEKTQVSTLAIGIADAYGFVGVGGYWKDTSGNGRIGAEDHPDTSAVGLAIQNLNVGLVVARELVLAPAGLKIGVYIAAQADIQSVKLVGVPDVTLQATGLQLDLNTGVRTVVSSGFTQDAATGAINFDTKKSGIQVSFPTIDFSKSNWKDMSLSVNKDADTTNDITHLGYAIPTGNPSHPIVLDYKDQLIRIHGQANLNLMGLVTMDGVLDFEFNASNGLTVFADVTATIGKKDSFSFSSHATGLLVVGKRNDIAGVALRLELEAGLNMGSMVSLDAKLELSLNTFGEKIVYDVPKDFQATLTKAQGTAVASHFPDWKYTIAATPTSKPDWTGAYVELLGNGNLNLLDGALKLDGDFGIVLSAKTGIEVNVSAKLQLPLLKPLAVVGTLGLISTGIYGSLEMGGANPGSVLIDSSAFTLAGHFLLQINTTGVAQKVRAINTSGQGATSVLVEVEAETLHIAGNVGIDVLGGALHLGGSMDMTIDKKGITAQAELKLELGPLGSIDVKGGIAFVLEGDTPVFALKLDTQIKLGTSLIGFSAGATLEINTGNQDQADVPGGQLFKLALTNGNIHILAFDIDFSGAMTLTNDNVFRLDFNGNLNFFGMLSIDVKGYIQSDLEFDITGSVHIGIDLGLLSLSAGMSMTLSSANDHIFAADVSGDIKAVGFLAIGFTGGVTLSRFSAEISASVTLGIGPLATDFSGSYTWEFGDPPKIAWQEGDTLHLNMGDDPGRYGSEDYKDIVNEDYKITKNGDDRIMVSSLGVESNYTGIKRIVADGGGGNDSIEIGAGVDALIDFKGGAGNDKVVIKGGAAGSKIYGGDGNDTFEGGDIGGMSWYGGGGNDKYTGGAGSARIEMGDGNNIISTGNGNNTVRIDGGSTVLNLGSGNNDILVSTAGAAINIKDGQNGYDHLIFDPLTSRGSILLGNHQLNLNDTTVVFGDGLDRISITDQNTVRSTVVTTVTKLATKNTTATEAQDWGSTDFELTSAGIIDVQNANFKMAGGHLTLIAPKGVDGILNTEIDGLTVVNNGSGALGDIVVREANSLNITMDDKANGGLYAINGKVAVQLNAKDSLLSLKSGAIVSNVEGITLVADKVNLLSGDNKVQSSGTTVMIAPVSPKSPILVDNLAAGTVGSDTFRLSTELLNYLKNESSEIQVGSHVSSSIIFIGRAGLATPITLSDTLRLLNPILGGDMFINAPLVLTNDASLIIEGSGQSGAASLDKAYILGTPGEQPQASGSSFGLGNYDYSVNTLLL